MTTKVEVKSPFELCSIHPQLLDHGKTAKRLIKGQVISSEIQVVADGGETNLHCHPGNEAIWLVLNGEATFHTTGDEVAAVVGRYEALLVPAGTPYWFESSSDENLVILRIGAQVAEVEKNRIDLSERRFGGENATSNVERRPVIFKEGVFFGE